MQLTCYRSLASWWVPCKTHGPSFRRQGGSLCLPSVARCRFSKARATRERVLRYPSGECRYIRYPISATVDEDEDESSIAAWDITGIWSTAASAGRHKEPGLGSGDDKPAASLLDTATYLEGLFAASYEAEPLVDVEHSYQILHGCPWVLPRPVYVLTSKGKGSGTDQGTRNMYTLRTKVMQEGAADALAKLLNKQYLADALEVAEMRDGVVVFEHGVDADRYASMLEEEGHSQVAVSEVDSHRLFRTVSDVQGLVVLLPYSTDIPAPYQLAASLKQKRSWDSM